TKGASRELPPTAACPTDWHTFACPWLASAAHLARKSPPVRLPALTSIGLSYREAACPSWQQPSPSPRRHPSPVSPPPPPPPRPPSPTLPPLALPALPAATSTMCAAT